MSELTLEPIASLEAAREDWTRLAEASGELFSTWEWAAAWWRQYGEGRPLHLMACRDEGGAVVGILPFYLARARPIRMLRFVGHGPADRLAPVCAPEDRPRVAAALRRALDEKLAGWHVAVLDRLPGEQGWPEMLGEKVFRTEPSPTLVTEGKNWDEFLASRSKNFRDQVKGRERKLAKKHELSYRLSDDPERLEEDLGILIRLHHARWGEESRSFKPPRDALLREFAAEALKNGWLRLWQLDLDGQTVAAWLGYRFGGVEWYYQAGRDPALERENVGFVLMTHTIRDTMNDGATEYRLLLGGEAYKDRFATADHAVETVVFARGPRGRTAHAAARSALGAPPRLRRRLRRLESSSVALTESKRDRPHPPRRSGSG